VLAKEMKRSGLTRQFSLSAIQFPFKELLSFTLPMLSSDLVIIAMHSADALMLGYFWGTTEVGSFRVILPLALLNRTVMTTFGLLYTPTASRLFAQGDIAGINELYWRTTVWLSALTFPIFAITFGAAKPITVLVFGERYADAGPLLAILSCAYYFDSALGFNGLTLKVLGCYRRIVTINVIAALGNVGLNLFLIPKYGAWGAAVGTSASIIVYNFLKQYAMGRVHPIKSFAPQYTGYCLLLGGAIMALTAIQGMADHVVIDVLLAVAISVIVLWKARKHLLLDDVFPEALKWRRKFALAFGG
jgi:O-antigen/teichoic acid export membrane protein